MRLGRSGLLAALAASMVGVGSAASMPTAATTDPSTTRRVSRRWRRRPSKRTRYGSPESQARRISAAEAKRERRRARNLRHVKANGCTTI